MTLFIKLATSAIKKFPFVPLCQSGKLHNKEIPLFEKACPERSRRERQGRFWTRVIG